MARVASRHRIVVEGALGGLIAGASLAAGQLLAAAWSGVPPGTPWQLWSSLVLGREALDGGLSLLRFVLGFVLNFGLSTAFGALFGLVVAAIRRPLRDDLAVQLTGGAIYGIALWAINYQIIGRLFFPWFSVLNPGVQLLIHALFYGLPLATWMALTLRDLEVPGVHEARHRYQTSTGDEEWDRLQHHWKEQEETAEESPLAPFRPPHRGGERPPAGHPGDRQPPP